MRTKTLLLQSVSAIATAAAATGQVQAQDAVTPDGYTFSVQGGALFSNRDSELSEYASYLESWYGIFYDPYFEFNDFPVDIGYNAAFTIGKRFDTEWDVTFGASINRLIENGADVYASAGSSSSYYSGFASGYSSYSSGWYFNDFAHETRSFGFETLDFEVGYSPVLDNSMNVRLFAGIRGLHFLNEMSANWGGESGWWYSGYYTSGYGDYISSYSAYYFDMYSGMSSIKSEFFGAGPRIGVSASHRFEGSNFGISGMVAGAAIFGRQTDTISFTSAGSWGSGYSGYYYNNGSGYSYGSGSGSSYSYSDNYTVTEDKMVVDLQAQLGLDYYLDDSAKLTVGYQAEQLMNVGPIGDDEQNLLVHGPFLKLSGQF